MSSFTTPLKYEYAGYSRKFNPVYTVTEEFDYAFGSKDEPIAVFHIPSGFTTDFASIPFPFNRIFHPDGPWAKAAVVHDWLCDKQPDVSYVVKDSIFLEAMYVLGINHIVAWIFFTAVRTYHDLKGRA